MFLKLLLKRLSIWRKLTKDIFIVLLYWPLSDINFKLWQRWLGNAELKVLIENSSNTGSLRLGYLLFVSFPKMVRIRLSHKHLGRLFLSSCLKDLFLSLFETIAFGNFTFALIKQIVFNFQQTVLMFFHLQFNPIWCLSSSSHYNFFIVINEFLPL